MRPCLLNVKNDSCESFVETICVVPGALDLEGAAGQQQGLWPTTNKATTRPALEASPLTQRQN